MAEGMRLWLIGANGPLEGRRFEVIGPVFRLGTDSNCDLKLEDESVRPIHMEIRCDGDSYTLVAVGGLVRHNGSESRKAVLQQGDRIRLGESGPQFEVRCEARALFGVAEAVVISEVPKAKPKNHESLIAEAVSMAREARGAGHSGQTTSIMRDLVLTAVQQSRRKHRVALLFVVVLLLGVVAASTVGIAMVKRESRQIHDHITQLEMELQAVEDPQRIDQLLAELDAYELKARKIQKSMLYELGTRDESRDFVEAEIRLLLQKFGADSAVVPTEFVDQVNIYLAQYMNENRATVHRVLSEHAQEMTEIRQILESYHLPPDLSYMVLVESSFKPGSKSGAGAVGIWQFMPPTARSYGLTVNKEVDERYDIPKSTHAAAKYLRDLILEFGSGHSVMLALAAYNTGPTRVRKAVRKVDDPIRQRNFWYLYRTRALPRETREYVPKIIAAIIVGRNPERFGFSLGIPS
ncbi:MAG: transglycosylase SLT domain-containing protein [Acidobacteria bacterium]|nr:transglycosylase SLT domain-containing protein [Acidobacteriota bacterium]